MAVHLINTKRNIITIQVLGPLEEIEHLVIPLMASGPLILVVKLPAPHPADNNLGFFTPSDHEFMDNLMQNRYYDAEWTFVNINHNPKHLQDQSPKESAIDINSPSKSLITTKTESQDMQYLSEVIQNEDLDEHSREFAVWLLKECKLSKEGVPHVPDKEKSTTWLEKCKA